MTTEPLAERPQENALRRMYHKNPYVALGVAFGAGYLVAGGLVTPFSRRLIKMGMKALVVPMALSQLKNVTQGLSQEP